MIGKASEIKTALFNPDISDGLPLDCHINLWLVEHSSADIIQILFTESITDKLLTRASALIIYKEEEK